MIKALFFLAVCAHVDAAILNVVAYQDQDMGKYDHAALKALNQWKKKSEDKWDLKVAVEEIARSSITSRTDPAHANKVHVVWTPYGSGRSKTAIKEIHPDYTGVVMVWGASSDDIWTENTLCASRKFKCYGTFTVASEYMHNGLEVINAAYEDELQVLLVEQKENSFSKSVCNGAKDKIGNTDGIVKQKHLELLENVSAANIAALNAALEEKPDVVVLCGLSGGFVERIVKEAKTHESVPPSILGTNTLTPGAKDKLAEFGENRACVMMPTQWADTGQKANDFTKFSASDFRENTAAESQTYHIASAWASLIALSNAAEDGNFAENGNVDDLKNQLDSLDEDTFYGKLKFDSWGRIKKGMLTQQFHDDHLHLVGSGYETLMSCVTGEFVSKAWFVQVWLPFFLVVMKAMSW